MDLSFWSTISQLITLQTEPKIGWLKLLHSYWFTSCTKSIPHNYPFFCWIIQIIPPLHELKADPAQAGKTLRLNNAPRFKIRDPSHIHVCNHPMRWSRPVTLILHICRAGHPENYFIIIIITKRNTYRINASLFLFFFENKNTGLVKSEIMCSYDSKDMLRSKYPK